MAEEPLKPTEAELEILQILWQNGECTVRFVNDMLNQKKETGYTTTLKFMQIMHDKGLVTRVKDGKTHIYIAAIAEQSTKKHLLEKFVDTVFRGSAMDLMMQALGNKKPSKNDLDQIRKMLDKMDREND
jgi:BlaI family transcriptional regulator, penicillinase repressor